MPPLTEEEQRLLLRLARRAIEQTVQPGTGSPEQIDRDLQQPLSAALLAPAGVFVTLRRYGELRGCMGVIAAERPLYQAVQDCAVSAALFDPRFTSVTAGELADLQTGISVLSPIEPITPEQIEIGRHGLLITQGDRRGLLLPQVASEREWGRERFLEETCAKAGLPRDAWRRGANVLAFTAQTFLESSKTASYKPEDRV